MPPPPNGPKPCRFGARWATPGRDAQRARARVVVVSQRAGRRLDLDLVQALPVEQVAREVERIHRDARIDLVPLAICRPDAVRSPQRKQDAGHHDQQDVRQETPRKQETHL